MVMSSFTMVNQFEGTKLTIKYQTLVRHSVSPGAYRGFWMILLPLPTGFAFGVSKSHEIQH